MLLVVLFAQHDKVLLLSSFLQLKLTDEYTDKKENLIFLIYKEIQNGAVAKSYMTNGLLIHVHIWGNI